MFVYKELGVSSLIVWFTFDKFNFPNAEKITIEFAALNSHVSFDIKIELSK